MEIELIAALSAGGAALLFLLLFIVAARGRRKARRRADTLAGRVDGVLDRVESHRSGEREAAWALSEATQRVEDLRQERDHETARAARLEGDIDELRARLSQAHSDITDARARADEVESEVARLEAEVAAARAAAPEPSQSVAADTDHDRADLLRDATEAKERLAAERETVARLRSELEALHGQVDRADPSDADRERLIVSEARRRDLEDRLEAVTAMRASEQRRVAEELAQANRLHVEIEKRERRLEEVEAALKDAEEGRDEAVAEAARLQVELTHLKGELDTARRRLQVLEEHSRALAEARDRIAQLEAEASQQASGSSDELERLRKSLEAERSRAERIARRAADGTGESAPYAAWDRVLRERVTSAVERESARLREQVEHLRAVVAEKEHRIQQLAAATDHTGPQQQEDPEPEHEDVPVTAISGVGPAIARILAGLGITTIRQIAALTDADIDRISDDMPVYPRRIRDDDWVGQAKQIVARLDQGEPPFPEEEPAAGPPPITAIKGIGPAIAEILADLGITTIRQVAALSDSDIERISDDMPVYPGRIRDDDWVGQAKSFM